MVKNELFQQLWSGIEDMVLRHVNDALTIHEDVCHPEEDEEECGICGGPVNDGDECRECWNIQDEDGMDQSDMIENYIRSLENVVKQLNQIILLTNKGGAWLAYPHARQGINDALRKKPTFLNGPKLEV